MSSLGEHAFFHSCRCSLCRFDSDLEKRFSCASPYRRSSGCLRAASGLSLDYFFAEEVSFALPIRAHLISKGRIN